MKKILIICPWYFPLFHPRPFRWTNIAEALASEGHEVHVLCTKLGERKQEEVINNVLVHRVGFESLKEIFYTFFKVKNQRGRVSEKVVLPSKSSFLFSFFIKIYTFLKKMFFPDESIIWYWSAEKRAKALAKTHHFSDIISVSMPFTSHLIGLKLKKEFPTIHWIVDIGDPLYNKKYNTWRALYKPFLKKIEKNVLQKADKVSVTNQNLVAYYEENLGINAAKMKVIFPLSMFGNKAFSKPVQNIPTLAYFGAFYTPERTPAILIDFLNVLKNHAIKVNVEIYGDILPAFTTLFVPFENVVIKGLASRKDTEKAMLESDILINIGNTTAWQLPSKIADYIAVQKPILHFLQVENDPCLDFFSEDDFVVEQKMIEKETFISDFKIFLKKIETPDNSFFNEKITCFKLPYVVNQYKLLLSE
jgi:glycosyltransferase involved in cell wall biosynthesis